MIIIFDSDYLCCRPIVVNYVHISSSVAPRYVSHINQSCINWVFVENDTLRRSKFTPRSASFIHMCFVLSTNSTSEAEISTAIKMTGDQGTTGKPIASIDQTRWPTR